MSKEIFSKRLIFVVGKGGVGKTTLSVSLAIAAARSGKKILIVEVGDADSVGEVFNIGTLPQTPRKLYSNIWGARIFSKQVLEDYINTHVKLSFVANQITRSKLFEHIAAATPGLKEVMTLGQIWRWEQEKGASNYPKYDLIIVDAPATGHGTSLLKLPKTLIDMLKGGPIVEQTKVVHDMLTDKNKTWLTLVTLPEELPVNESIEFRNTAKNDINMPVKITFINGVYSELFSEKNFNVIENILNNKKFMNKDKLNDYILKVAKNHYIRRNIQKKYISKIKEKAEELIIEIPFYFINDIKVKDSEQIAQLLINKLK